MREGTCMCELNPLFCRVPGHYNQPKPAPVPNFTKRKTLTAVENIVEGIVEIAQITGERPLAVIALIVEGMPHHLRTDPEITLFKGMLDGLIRASRARAEI